MTNPDRDELVKLLVWGKSRITGEVGVMAQDAYTSIGNYIASDNGWFLQGQSGWNASASMDAAKSAAQADYEARIRSALVEVPAVKGEPEPVAWQRRNQFPSAPGAVPQWEQCSKDEAGHFERQPGYKYRTLYLAPPADAGMREALERSIRELEYNRANDYSPDITTINRLKDQVLAALTAPGAKTKSDGGGESRPARALLDQFDIRRKK